MPTVAKAPVSLSDYCSSMVIRPKIKKPKMVGISETASAGAAQFPRAKTSLNELQEAALGSYRVFDSVDEKLIMKGQKENAQLKQSLNSIRDS